MSSSSQTESTPPSNNLASTDSPGDALTSSPSPSSDNADASQAIALPPSHPLPPPSESLQYRAVGLIRARYLPSAEEHHQGTLVTSDGTLIDAVVLGRLTSLLKNHLNLDEEHLWVVYPRTRPEPPKLHMQMVGVWSPQTLHPQVESQAATTPIEPDYFSVRGEVVYQQQQEGWVIVKVVQKPKTPQEKPRFIKLQLAGTLNEKAAKTFWSFDVKRIGENLVIEEGQKITSFTQPKPRKSGPPRSKFQKRRPPGGPPQAQTPRPAGTTLPKPKPKPKGSSNQ